MEDKPWIENVLAIKRSPAPYRAIKVASFLIANGITMSGNMVITLAALGGCKTMEDANKFLEYPYFRKLLPKAPH